MSHLRSPARGAMWPSQQCSEENFIFFGGGGVTIIIFYNYIYSNVPGVGGTNFSYLYFSTRQFC